MSFSFRPTQADVHDQHVDTNPALSKDLNAVAPLPFNKPDTGMGFIRGVLLLIFCCTLIVAGGLAWYAKYLTSQIDLKKAKLAEYESSLGGVPLEDIRQLSDRIQAINTVLSQRASVNTAFSILEHSIENQVTYTSFKLTHGNTGKVYDLAIGVVSPSYRALAQQLDTFAKDPAYKNYIARVTYSALALDIKTGQVSSTFKMPLYIAGKNPENITFMDDASLSTSPSVSGTLLSFASSSPSQQSPVSSATSTFRLSTSTTPQ